MNSRQIVVDDQLLNYYETGDGPVVLCVHGWGDDGRTFTSLANSLESKYKVVSLDLPGFGSSVAPKDVWGLNEYANIVSGFIGKLGLKPRAIIGHSNGAAIAIRLLAHEPDLAEKLVILGGAGIRNQDQVKKKAVQIAAKTAKVMTMPLPKKTRQKLRKQAYGAIGSDMFVAEHLQETFKQVVSDDVQADALNIKQLTLLIYGEDDTATPVTFGKIYASIIPRSSLVVIPHAGHFVHIDAAVEVQENIMEFLS